MDTNDKNCGNCKYAIQHYAKLRGRLIRLNRFIHCSNGRTPKKQFEKCLREDIACRNWQDDGERLEKEKTDTKNLLIQISKQLTDVIMILNEEKEDNPYNLIDKTGLF